MVAAASGPESGSTGGAPAARVSAAWSHAAAKAARAASSKARPAAAQDLLIAAAGCVTGLARSDAAQVGRRVVGRRALERLVDHLLLVAQPQRDVAARLQ